jgi:hypothetical protein
VENSPYFLHYAEVGSITAIELPILRNFTICTFALYDPCACFSVSRACHEDNHKGHPASTPPPLSLRAFPHKPTLAKLSLGPA